MQKEFYFSNKPPGNEWDYAWFTKTIEQELKACDIESPPRELFLSYLPREGKILDAGCGLGKWVIYLHHRGYDIVGIDNSATAIAKLKDFDKSLQVELGDILDIHYPENFFDAYISMGIVEHFEDGPTSALNEAYRVLKPNGLIFVSVPTVNVIRKLVRRPLRNSINKFITLFLTIPYIILRTSLMYITVSIVSAWPLQVYTFQTSSDIPSSVLSAPLPFQPRLR